MAAHDRLLQVPGEGSGLSQVMSPSAQEQLASVTSALELGNPAYGAIQSTLQVAPGDSRPSEAHLSGYSNGMVNPNVYDPAPSAGPEDVGSSRRAFPDMAAPIGEPHQERDGTAGRPSPTGLQPAAFTMASGAQQQQPTMEESLATSRLATRPSTRTADQTLPGGGPHPVVRWVTRLTGLRECGGVCWFPTGIPNGPGNDTNKVGNTWGGFSDDVRSPDPGNDHLLTTRRTPSTKWTCRSNFVDAGTRASR